LFISGNYNNVAVNFQINNKLKLGLKLPL